MNGGAETECSVVGLVDSHNTRRSSGGPTPCRVTGHLAPSTPSGICEETLLHDYSVHHARRGHRITACQCFLYCRFGFSALSSRWSYYFSRNIAFSLLMYFCVRPEP